MLLHLNCILVEGPIHNAVRAAFSVFMVHTIFVSVPIANVQAYHLVEFQI